MKTIEHPCSVPGWEIFEYQDKSWSTLFYWRDDEGLSADIGAETKKLADQDALEEFADRASYTDDDINDCKYINQGDFTGYAKRIEKALIAKQGKAPTYVTVLNHCSNLIKDCVTAGRGHSIKVPVDWRKQMKKIALAI